MSWIMRNFVTLASLSCLVVSLPHSSAAMPNFTVGVWQSVEPAAFHSPSNMQTIAVVVNPQNSYVYAAASNKTNGGSGSTGIYRSTDCGSTWTLWGTGTGASNLATGQLWAMLIDPTSPQNMYVANGYGDNNTLFKSTDGGVNWFPLNPDASHVLSMQFVQDVALERGNSQHIAVTFHVNGAAPFNSNIMSQSTDGGATWQEFNGPSQVDGWQEGATLTILGPNSYFYGCSVGGFFTSNGGQSWSQGISQGIFGRYAGSTELTPDGSALYIGVSNTGTFSSRASAGTPLGSSWTLIPNTQFFTNMIDDGVTMYGATVNGPPFWSAKLSAPTVWTHLSSPGVADGSNEMAYDANNHIIYSANFENGLWALKTQANSGTAVDIPNRSIASDQARVEMRMQKDGLSVTEPAGKNWKLDIFEPNGKDVMNTAGYGSAIVSFVNNRLSGNGSLIACLRTATGGCVKKLIRDGR